MAGSRAAKNLREVAQRSNPAVVGGVLRWIWRDWGAGLTLASGCDTVKEGRLGSPGRLHLWNYTAKWIRALWRSFFTLYLYL